MLCDACAQLLDGLGGAHAAGAAPAAGTPLQGMPDGFTLPAPGFTGRAPAPRVAAAAPYAAAAGAPAQHLFPHGAYLELVSAIILHFFVHVQPISAFQVGHPVEFV